jgi:hypothetical protein
MQPITNKDGSMSLRLLQVEERKIRDAAYIIRLAGRTLEGSHGDRLVEAATVLLDFAINSGAMRGKDKLDGQDAQLPEVATGSSKGGYGT